MSGARRCVLASSNAGKLREFERLLAPLAIVPVAQDALGIEPAPEPHPTFVENALAKARHASRIARMPALADDSGICVPSLGGAPGVYSARYAQTRGAGQGDAANNACLVAALREHDPDGRDDRHWRAYYYCVLVWLRHADDPQPLIADALWWGRVVPEPRGSRGFGYDPHFWLPDQACTAAELAPDDKNRISHRGQALALLGRRLAED